MTDGQRVADFLGRGNDETFVALAGQHAQIINAMAQAYTRGRGFTDGVPADDLAAVITTATARLVVNPDQLPADVNAGPFSKKTYAGFKGWSLAETFVLDRYRKKAL